MTGYQPKYRTKKAPGKAPGYIAWDDATASPSLLRYNGPTKKWQVCPIEGDSKRVDPGFVAGDPVAECDSKIAAWFWASSRGTQTYSPPAPAPLGEHAAAVVERAKVLPKAARDAISAIAAAPTGMVDHYDVDTIHRGEPDEITRFSATRTVDDLTVTVEQEFLTDGPTVVKSKPTVSIKRADTFIVHSHTLSGEKHMPWFFGSPEDAIKAWTAKAEKRLKRTPDSAAKAQAA